MSKNCIYCGEPCFEPNARDCFKCYHLQRTREHQEKLIEQLSQINMSLQALADRLAKTCDV